MRYKDPDMDPNIREMLASDFCKKAAKVHKARKKEIKICENHINKYLKKGAIAPKYAEIRFKRSVARLKKLNILFNKHEVIYRKAKENAALYDKDH